MQNIYNHNINLNYPQQTFFYQPNRIEHDETKPTIRIFTILLICLFAIKDIVTLKHPTFPTRCHYFSHQSGRGRGRAGRCRVLRPLAPGPPRRAGTSGELEIQRRRLRNTHDLRHLMCMYVCAACYTVQKCCGSRLLLSGSGSLIKND